MNKFIRTALFFLTISLINSHAVAVEKNDEFETKLSEYITAAKAVSKKQFIKEDWKKLITIALGITSYIKQNIKEKLTTDEFALEYSLPDDLSGESQQKSILKIIKFTKAIYKIYANLNTQRIAQIITKSPLEMVSLLREIYVLSQFVTANPQDYGHGVLSEKNGTTTKIFASNMAINRIMRPLVYQHLLSIFRPIYKLSRITTAFYNKDNETPFEETYKEVLSSMKRNTASDARIALTVPEKGGTR
jgi:hypothetical protein